VRVQKLPKSEIEIGQRLRAFREASNISRTAFATSIGIGSERLASYETGRVPLRYEVAHRIHKAYSVNLGWLVTGRGLAVRFDRDIDNYLKEPIPPKQLLSDAYTNSLRPLFPQARREAINLVNEKIRPALKQVKTFFSTASPEEIKAFAKRFPDLLDTLRTATHANIDEIDEVTRLQEGQERMNENLRLRGLKMGAEVDDWD
jgi:transcriptional regulator with XRE-family HTH domain